MRLTRPTCACSVRCLIALLDEPSRSVARFTRSLAHLCRERRATVKMTANTLGQVRATPGAQMLAVAEKVRA